MLGGRYVEAAEDYDRAFELSPSRETALKSFSAALSARADNPTAPLTAWLEKDPDDSQFARILNAAGRGGAETRAR